MSVYEIYYVSVLPVPFLAKFYYSFEKVYLCIKGIIFPFLHNFLENLLSATFSM